MFYQFPKKFATPRFECYTKVTDPINTPVLSGQVGGPLSRRPPHVLGVSLQSQGRGLRLFLLHPIMVSLKLRGG